jgi:hypothetical protein
MKRFVAWVVWMAAMIAAAKAGTGIETLIAVVASTVYFSLPRRKSSTKEVL